VNISWEERNDRALQNEIKKGSNSFPSLNYLKLTKRQQIAMSPLEDALDSREPNCKNRSADFIDYHEDYEPTAEVAYQMCGGCAMLVECGRFANAYKPPVGVWGGQVWRDGRVVSGEND
jgi:hypothetical protein